MVAPLFPAVSCAAALSVLALSSRFDGRALAEIREREGGSFSTRSVESF